MTSLSTTVKTVYARALQGTGRALSGAGILSDEVPDRQSDRTRHWVKSLFAVYDIDGLIRLDVPWWTYDAIDVVDAFLASRPGARVFEYGSGASTVWLARRAGSVTSVEHHQDWCQLVAQRLETHGLADRARLLFHAPSENSEPGFGSQKPGYAGKGFRAYVTAIEDTGAPFDLIVIDGRAREACLAAAIGRLTPGGMIVFDNSHRARYRAAIATVPNRTEVFRGRTPSLPYADETTLIHAAV